jgi:hypothetical protein
MMFGGGLCKPPPKVDEVFFKYPPPTDNTTIPNQVTTGTFIHYHLNIQYLEAKKKM